MANLLSRLIDPWYPATAIGLEKGVASVVQLERVRGSVCKLRRAATFNIAESLVRPSFEETNIESPPQVAAVLNDLEMLKLAIESNGNTRAITSPYGGTALISLFIGLGLLMSVQAHRKLVNT